MDYIKLILFSYCINYPVLASWGKVCYKPIALLFDDLAYAQNYVKELGYQPIVDAGYMKIEDLREKMLFQANSDGIFMFLTNPSSKFSHKVHEKLDFFLQAAFSGKIEQEELGGPCFLCIIGMVPDYLKDILFIIKMEKVPDSDDAPKLSSFLINEEKLPLVEDKLKDLSMELHEEEWLYAAVSFLYPGCREFPEKGILDKLLQKAVEISKMNRLYQEADLKTDTCIDLLLDNTRRGEFDESVNLGERFVIPDDADEKWFSERTFIRGNDIFMSEGTFNRIFECLLCDLPIDVIKSTLCKAGIIEREGKGYTTKMYCHSKQRQYNPRMIRMHMQLISDGCESMDEILEREID